MDTLLIIGGGAAGLMAGVAAGEAGIPAMILERRHRPGLKLLMCGNNRCNISHDAKPDGMLRQYGGNIAHFLASAINAFPPAALRTWFQKYGLRTIVKRERIYPIGENADDVLHLFVDQLRELKVPIALNCPVRSIARQDNGMWCVTTENGMVFQAKYVLLATGGISYPKTGSVGDGQRMAQELGHNVTPLKPGLAGFDTESPLFQNLKEANIEETVVRIVDGKGIVVAETQGNILCSNGILRGTAIFDAVRQIAHKNIGDFTAVADILPAVKPGTQGNLAALMAKCDIPQDLARNIIARYGKMPAAVAKLKELPLEVTSIRPVKEAIVTAGGVSLQEIDPATMASRKEDGLFFAGELIDIDGPTGGYNLHAAFATARLAIAEITRRIKGKQSKSNPNAPRFREHTQKNDPNAPRIREHTQDPPKRRYGDPRSSVWRGK